MKVRNLWLIGMLVLMLSLSASAQDVLPFPEPVSASVTGKTLKDSKQKFSPYFSVDSL